MMEQRLCACADTVGEAEGGARSQGRRRSLLGRRLVGRVGAGALDAHRRALLAHVLRVLLLQHTDTAHSTHSRHSASARGSGSRSGRDSWRRRERVETRRTDRAASTHHQLCRTRELELVGSLAGACRLRSASSTLETRVFNCFVQRATRLLNYRIRAMATQSDSINNARAEIKSSKMRHVAAKANNANETVTCATLRSSEAGAYNTSTRRHYKQ